MTTYDVFAERVTTGALKVLGAAGRRLGSPDSVVGVVAARDGNRGVRVTDQCVDGGAEAQAQESAVAA